MTSVANSYSVCACGIIIKHFDGLQVKYGDLEVNMGNALTPTQVEIVMT